MTPWGFLFLCILLFIPFSLSIPWPLENNRNFTHLQDTDNTISNFLDDDLYFDNSDLSSEGEQTEKPQAQRMQRSPAEDSFKQLGPVLKKATYHAAKKYGWYGNTGSKFGSNYGKSYDPNYSTDFGTDGNANSVEILAIGNGDSSARSGQIRGGQLAPNKKFPWQVALLDSKKRFFCGGTLIANQWVMSAAHCNNPAYVRLGDVDLRKAYEIKVDKYLTLKEYKAKSHDYDISFVKLHQPVSYSSYVRPASIPQSNSPPPRSKTCYISGWGRNEYGKSTSLLKYAQVPIVNMENCEEKFSNVKLTDKQICAGYKNGHIDVCSGDSGGPLVCYDLGAWKVYGITSFGNKCGPYSTYGVYTNVAKYVDLINYVLANY